MKKFLFLSTAFLICTSLQAQIVSSRSVGVKAVRTSSEKEHIIRIGLNMMNFAGDGGEDLDKKTGYQITYGFLKPMGSIGTYWGMDFGLGSRGYKFEEEGLESNLIAHNVQVSPFTFGWKYGITDAFKVDIHFGTFASFDYAGKIKAEYNGEEEELKIGDWNDELDLDWHRYDAGINAGFGVWFNQFNLDFNFQRGFIETAGESESYTNNFIIRLGVAF